jgi:hypothetical protein
MEFYLGITAPQIFHHESVRESTATFVIDELIKARVKASIMSRFHFSLSVLVKCCYGNICGILFRFCELLHARFKTF